MDNLKEKYKALFCEGQNNSDYAGGIFDSLFNYFRAFYIANFEVKILITRKSYMIFKIFEEVFEKDLYEKMLKAKEAENKRIKLEKKLAKRV